MRGGYARDIPWFVWLVGGVGVAALVVGYGLDLDSKAGDGLREMGWLGIGVLVTVAGVDVAQRRARAAEWAPVVDNLRQEARQTAVRLAATVWQDATWNGGAIRMFTRSLEPTDAAEDGLQAAYDDLAALWPRLGTAKRLYDTVGEIDQEAWRALGEYLVHLPSPGLTADLAASADRLVTLLDELRAADPDNAAALANVRTQVRDELDVYLRARAGAPEGGLLLLAADVSVGERPDLVMKLDLAMRVALHGSTVVGRLRELEALLRP